jgi:hypothetical protein
MRFNMRPKANTIPFSNLADTLRIPPNAAGVEQ